MKILKKLIEKYPITVYNLCVYYCIALCTALGLSDFGIKHKIAFYIFATIGVIALLIMSLVKSSPLKLSLKNWDLGKKISYNIINIMRCVFYIGFFLLLISRIIYHNNIPTFIINIYWFCIGLYVAADLFSYSLRYLRRNNNNN